MSSRSSRRKQTSSAVSAVLILALAGGLAFAGAPSAKPPPAATARAATTVPPPVVTAVHVRKEIHSLTATEITNYRKGVALMQSRSFSDPTSWIYQANMHGYPANNAICPVVGTPQPQWSTCQHGSFFFLASHRMYLPYFERILQASVRPAIGIPTYQFSLPCWIHA